MWQSNSSFANIYLSSSVMQIDHLCEPAEQLESALNFYSADQMSR